MLADFNLQENSRHTTNILKLLFSKPFDYLTSAKSLKRFLLPNTLYKTACACSDRNQTKHKFVKLFNYFPKEVLALTVQPHLRTLLVAHKNTRLLTQSRRYCIFMGGFDAQTK